MGLITCEDCGRGVSDQAAACPGCGRPTGTRPAQPGGAQPAPQKVVVAPSLGTAAVLSLVLPGLGQLYRGKVGAGILWLGGAVLGYMFFVVPGLLVHLLCIFDAAREDQPAASTTPQQAARSTGDGQGNPDEDSSQPVKAVAIEMALVRAQPDTTAEIVGRLLRGTLVRILAEQDGWIRVRVVGQGVEGWTIDRAIGG